MRGNVTFSIFSGLLLKIRAAKYRGWQVEKPYDGNSARGRDPFRKGGRSLFTYAGAASRTALSLILTPE